MAIAIAVMAVAQLVKGVTGFGSALVAVPFLTAIWGPVEGILAVTACDTVAGALLVRDTWHEQRVKLLTAMFLPLVVTQFIATGFLTTLPTDQVGLAISVVVGLFALDLVMRPVRKGRGELLDLPADPSRVLALASVAGGLSGMMQGIVGAGGPPIVIYARTFFADRFFRSLAIGIFFVGGISMISILGWREPTAIAPTGWRLLYLLPALLIGNRAGAALAGRVSKVVFSRAVGVLLLASAVGLAM